MTSTLQTCTAHPVCCEACAANWGWYSYDTDMHSSPSLVSLLWDMSSHLRLVQPVRPCTEVSLLWDRFRLYRLLTSFRSTNSIRFSWNITSTAMNYLALPETAVTKVWTDIFLKHHQYSYELSSSSWNITNKSVNRDLPETSPVQLWIIYLFLKHY